MKLNINKACDLSSISVLPPHSRRVNGNHSDSAGFSKNQASQFRSLSQQSFSQGMSLSQLSQNSFEENLVNEQRIGSQEREISMRRTPCMAPVSYLREESHIPISRSSNGAARRWSMVPTSDHRSQASEEFEHRIALMETHLSRLGMILDSVQNDIMQVNKSAKEILLATESIRQKMVLQDNSLHLAIKGVEDVKASLERSLTSILDQLRKESDQKLEHIESLLSAMPHQIRAQLLRLKSDLSWTITKEMENLINSKTTKENHQLSTNHLQKRNGITAHSPKKQLVKMEVPPAHGQFHTRIKKTPARNWKQAEPPPNSTICKSLKKLPLARKESDEWRIVIESDDEMAGGCSFFIEEKGTGTRSYLEKEVEVETRKLLKNARRRRFCSP